MEHALTSVKRYWIFAANRIFTGIQIFTGMHKLNTNAITVRRGTYMLPALTSVEVEDMEDMEDLAVEVEVVLVTILEDVEEDQEETVRLLTRMVGSMV
jgi:hypothetical protein